MTAEPGTRVLSTDGKAIDTAARCLSAGGLVAFPTETVYGLGADAGNGEAIARLYAAKGRPAFNPLIAHVGDIAAARQIARFDDPAMALAEAFWPGPLTLVCHQQGSLQWDLGDTRGTVAVRMPDHEVALALLERTGPLAVSSANLSGLPAATEADAADGMLGDSVEVVLDGGPSPKREASTILDVRGERPRLLRPGALSVADLNAVLEPLGATVDDDED